MKTLVIYDSTGRIWLQAHGETEVPQGLTSMFVDIPDGAILERIDVTDAENPQPVFTYLPETDIGRLQKSVKKLEENATVNTVAVTIAAETFTDEQALRVPTLYDEWAENTAYIVGKRVRFNDSLYKVITAHTSQSDWTPDIAPSLFAKVLVENPDVISEWVQPDSTNPYMKGDKVSHNGVTYESLVDDNVWEPGVVGSETLWKIVE